ncbi:DnaB-like helicase C-terminal domain-containing protein [Caenimonas terrae]|uniref:DnaB-like helicase C-terminal domain-containing protein n=1 Tax=Caenimonas terrae TaxID=696074 RepID=A0ABW0NJE1_9BURK
MVSSRALIAPLERGQRPCPGARRPRPGVGNGNGNGQHQNRRNIEQDADVIRFIDNPDTREPGIAEMSVAKQRDGAVGTVRLCFTDATNHLFESGDA